MVAMPRAETLVGTAETTSSVSDPSPKPGRRSILRRSALAALLLAGTAAAGYYGYQYWETGRFLVSTDDAYVQADYTTIAPKVSGYISTVLVADNATVKAGQVLARIDDRDFRTALDQATADVAAADFAVHNLDAQISLQDAAINQAKAQLAATQASLLFAQQDAGRYRALMQTGAGTIQQAQHTQASQQEIAAQVQRDQAALTAAERKIAVLTTARQEAVAQADHNRALRHQAELNLGYTVITAPVNGTVGARTLRVGQYVTAGTQLMAVVPLSAVYIVANYKETQLTDVRPGQTVAITVDGFPDASIKGRVDSISPASGLEFALLPPDNATGNFTKIVQRIPVKITFDDPALSGLLRSGMSVEPTIDTKPQGQASASTQAE
jgi:membrane fusion protein (multidrug efflux system)